MKRSFLIALACLFPVALIAASSQPQITLSVSLAASPAGQVTAGSPVTLTATATTQPHEFPKIGILQQHIRYTFTAKRTAPSPDTTAIATNVTARTVTWTPQNAGTYDISVRATYVGPTTLPATTERIIAPTAIASVTNYDVVAVPIGVDLVAITGTFAGSCLQPDCSQCPYTTIPIYVKNIGNATDAKPITVLVKFNGQVIQTWTTTAPAAGAQVKVGSYRSFLWNCPVITSQVNSTNYSITVDSTNAVAELNEQNNVHGFYLRFPDKTTFQGN
jgi:hypothetical protein